MKSDGDPQFAQRRFVNSLLTRPERLLACPDSALGATLARSTAVAAIALVFYGATAGTFQGGTQIVVAALKAPLIVATSLLLCAPSLLVLACLAGLEVSLRRLLLALSLVAAHVAVVLAAIAPISWLFSVASAGLLTPVLLHLTAWIVGLTLARKVFRVALSENRVGGWSRAWLLLVIVVSFQVTTLFRPVLWKDRNDAFFERGRKPFLEHFYETIDFSSSAPPTTDNATSRP